MDHTGTHTLVAARVVRAGDTTTLVAIPEWHSGQILVPVFTPLLRARNL